jgi:hypothetical protein
MGTKNTVMGGGALANTFIASNNGSTLGNDFKNSLYVSSNPAPAFNGVIGNTGTASILIGRVPSDFDDLNDAIITLAPANNIFFGINANTFSPISTTKNANFSNINSQVSCVKISPNSTTTNKEFYVATDGGLLLKYTWTQVGNVVTLSNPIDKTGNLPTMVGPNSVFIKSIDARGTDEMVVTYRFTGSTFQNVWYTNNLSAVTPTWTPLEDNTGASLIAGLPVNCVKFIEPGANNTLNAKLVIGTEIGIYYTNNINGANTPWSPDAYGPNIEVSDLQYRPTSDGILLMSTFGRGMWWSSAFISFNNDFIAEACNPCTSLHLKNTSTTIIGPTTWDLDGDINTIEATGNDIYIAYLINTGTMITMISNGVAISKPSTNQPSTCCITPNIAFLNSSNLDDIELYPNPATNTLNINNFIPLEDCILDILSLDGKLIQTIKGPNSTVDVSKLSAGMYILQIQNNGVKKSMKFTKE